MFRIPEPLPEWVPVPRAADVLGVSERRIRHLAANGRLVSSREHGPLLISSKDLIRRKQLRPMPVKPLNANSLRLVKDAMAPHYDEPASPLWKGADSSARSRAKSRAAKLREHPEPASLIRAWSLHEPPPVQGWASNAQARQLHAYASGFSHPAAGVSAPAQLEVRLPHRPRHLRAQRHPDEAPVLVIAHHDQQHERVRIMDAIFDLAQHGRDREDCAVERLIRS